MKIRLWLDKDTVKQCLTEDGDLVLVANELFFFKRNEIAPNEDGWHAEFSSPEGGFELHIPYYDLQLINKQVSTHILDKVQAIDYN